MGFFQLMQGIVDGLLHAITQLVAVFTQLLLGLEYEAVCTVELVNLFFGLLIGGLIGLGFVSHALDLIVAQTGTGLDADALLLTCALVFGTHVQDTVGINIKGHLDLRGSATGGRNAIQYKPTDGAVVFGHTALSLQNMYLYRGLVIGRSRKHLALLGRNGRVALYELGKYTAQGLDTEAQRGYVEQQHIFHFAGQHPTLDGSTNGHHFVGIHAFTGLLAKEFFHHLLDLRNTGRTTHQDHFVYIALAVSGIFQRSFTGLQGALYEAICQLLEFRTAQFLYQVLRHAIYCSDIRQVDLCL